MTRHQLTRPLFAFIALYTLANGYVHLREWLAGYRRIPVAVPGSWVVRVGFPVAALSAVALAGLLLLAATIKPRLSTPALAATAAFHGGTLGILIATRVGSVFGWAEPVWTNGANQVRLVALAGLLMVGLTLTLRATMLGERVFIRTAPLPRTVS